MTHRRSKIFVSYSHADKEYLQRLRIHLKPFERQQLVEVWADTKIVPGSNWKMEIRKAIDQCAAAILLISADFLASDFIAENELPPLLSKASEHGATILPVILKPCAYVDMPELTAFQSLNDPKEPLVSLDDYKREELWYKVAISVKQSIEVIGAISATEGMPTESSRDDLFTYSGDSDYFMPFDIADIDQYLVYEYQHMDDLTFMPLADIVFERHPKRDEIIEKMKNRFKRAGWEGDGSIQILWLPPFLGAGVEDTYGVCVWHVKQSNNGSSWIAAPVPLPFERLLSQNYRGPR